MLQLKIKENEKKEINERKRESAKKCRQKFGVEENAGLSENPIAKSEVNDLRTRTFGKQSIEQECFIRQDKCSKHRDPITVYRHRRVASWETRFPQIINALVNLFFTELDICNLNSTIFVWF